MKSKTKILISWIGAICGLGCGIAFAVTLNYYFILASAIVLIAILMIGPGRTAIEAGWLHRRSKVVRWGFLSLYCIACIGIGFMSMFIRGGEIEVVDILGGLAVAALFIFYLVGIAKGKIKMETTIPDTRERIGRIYSEEERRIEEGREE